MFSNLGGAVKNITAKAEELVEEKKNAAVSLLEKQVKETGEFLAHTVNEAEGKAVNAAEEAQKVAVDGFDQEVEKLADSALQESGGGLHAGLDLGSLLGDTVRNMTSPAKTTPAAAAPEPATPAAAEPVGKQTAAAGAVGQIASEAKTLVDNTAAQLKPVLDHVVQDTINPVAQGLAHKLQPIAGDVSAQVNTALAEGVKQLSPIVDDVTSKAKDLVDNTAKQVSSVVDEKLKEADELVNEKREALGEPAKSVLSKAKGFFGCKLDCCTIT